MALTHISLRDFVIVHELSLDLSGGFSALTGETGAGKSILIDASGIFASDMMGLGAQLQRTYRQGYALDTRNSAITALRNTSGATVIEVLSHFAAASIAPRSKATTPTSRSCAASSQRSSLISSMRHPPLASAVLRSSAIRPGGAGTVCCKHAAGC